jgi:two-component system OmpR family sensor kinase
MIEAKKIILKTDITKNVAIMIDENDAIRLIDNLISNAIKYNKQKGSLEIILDKIHLSIKDSGIGMKKSELQMIFKRFERSNRSEGGFGIGMDIVSQIISFYDFKIDIQSKEKMGTKVNVRW